MSLATGSELLFLYELEYLAYVSDRLLHVSNLGQRAAAWKVSGDRKKEIPEMDCRCQCAFESGNSSVFQIF